MDSSLVHFADDLDLAGRSPCTKRIYLAAVHDLAAFHGRSPKELGADDVHTWIQALRGRGLSSQRLRHHLSALKFLYAKTLGRPGTVSFLSFPKDRQRLPTVLSINEVKRLLAVVREPKFRVFFCISLRDGPTSRRGVCGSNRRHRCRARAAPSTGWKNSHGAGGGSHASVGASAPCVLEVCTTRPSLALRISARLSTLSYRCQKCAEERGPSCGPSMPSDAACSSSYVRHARA